ncbi:MAG: hypothetical protein U0Q16_11350 [Bryobacteraceae bacterium]
MWPAMLTPEQLGWVRAFDQAHLEPVKDRKSLREFFRLVVASSFPDSPKLRTLEYLELHLNLRERAIRELARRLGELLDAHYGADGPGGRSLTRMCLNTLDRGQPSEAERNARYRITFETNEKCHRFGLRNLLKPFFESERGVALVASPERTIGEALLRQTIEDALAADDRASVQEARHRVPVPAKDGRDLVWFGPVEGVEIPDAVALPDFEDSEDRVSLVFTRLRTRRDTCVTVIAAQCGEAYEAFNGLVRSEAAMMRFFDRIPSRRQILGNEFSLLLSFPIDEDREVLSVEANFEDWAGIEEERADVLPKPAESEIALPRHQIHRPARKVAR